MSITLILMFIGPALLHKGFQLRNYLTLIVAGIICITAIVLFFRGINTIMKALFNDQ